MYFIFELLLSDCECLFIYDRFKEFAKRKIPFSSISKDFQLFVSYFYNFLNSTIESNCYYLSYYVRKNDTM